MIPGTRANLTVATSILTALDYGDQADSTSDGTLPLMSFFDDISDQLITAVIATLVGDTATISTAGLTAGEIAQLTGIRSRVDAAVIQIYADTPNISPYYTSAGVPLTSGQQANRRDQIIQAIFNYDGRYFLRQRAASAQGGFNEAYELPSRYSYIHNPVIEALLGPHGLTRLAGTVDDNGSGGTYRITTTVPHGTYDGISFYAAYFGGNSVVTKPYWLNGLSQSDSANGLGTDTSSRFRFNANIGTNYLLDGTVAVGSQILAEVDTSWIALNYQPTRYFKLVDSGAAFEFYRDSALTDQIIPGFGYIGAVSRGFNNATDVPSQTPTGGIQVITTAAAGAPTAVHMMFEDIPQIFEPPAGWTGNLSVYENRPITSVNPGTDVYSVTQTTGSSIYNGQLVNARQNAGASASEWSTWSLNTELQYFNRYLGSESQVQLYTDAAMTQVYQLGVEANTITSITYPGGNAQLNFSSAYPPLIGGMVVAITGTTTGFSVTRNADAVAGTTPFRITLDANHSFQNGQPVGRVQGGQFYVKTTGMAANEIELYTNPGLTTAFQATVGNDFAPVYFVKRIANSTWGLYVDAALAVPFTTVISTAGFTTGSMVKTTAINSTLTLTAPADMRFQPMFYCRMGGYTTATLWVDAARTIPYAYIYANGIAGDVTTMGQLGAGIGGLYRINNQAHAAGFTANIKPQIGSMSQVFWVDSVSGTALDLYVNSARSARITSPAITSPQTIDGLVPTYLDGNPRYRIETFAQKNVGSSTYFYDSTGSGERDTVEASWGFSGQRWYTPDTRTNTQVFVPNIIVEEYKFANAGPYYGHLRRIEASGTVSNTSAVVYSTSSFGGVGTGPCVYSLSQPGAYMLDTPFIVGIGANADVVPATLSADDAALANTAPWWDTLTNVEDRTLRQWPTTRNPVSMTWTIEKPVQSVETVNLTRFNRSRDVTRYRMRLVYPPLKIDEIQEYLTIINAARGSFKQMKLQVPIADTAPNEIGPDRAITVRYYDRKDNVTVPFYMRARSTMAGGTRVVEGDGAPVNLNATVGTPGVSDYMIGAGHPMSINEPESLTTSVTPDPVSNANGSWYMPIHNVETNSWGEFNMRLANGVPEGLEVGSRLYRDAGTLNVFLDGNTVEIKVDVLGYHYMEVEFITGKIF
jgi:hypothetical protein